MTNKHLNTIDKAIKASFADMRAQHALRDKNSGRAPIYNMTISVAATAVGTLFLFPVNALIVTLGTSFFILQTADIFGAIRNNKVNKKIKLIQSALQEKIKEYSSQIEKDYALKFSQIEAISVDDFFILESCKIKPYILPSISPYGEKVLSKNLFGLIRSMNETLKSYQDKLYEVYKLTNAQTSSGLNRSINTLSIKLNSSSQASHPLTLTKDTVDRIFANPEFNLKNFMVTNPENLAIILAQSGHTLSDEHKAALLSCLTDYTSYQECKSFLTYFAKETLSAPQMKLLFDLTLNKNVSHDTQQFLNILACVGAPHNSQVFLEIQDYISIINPSLNSSYKQELNKAVYHLKNNLENRANQANQSASQSSPSNSTPSQTNAFDSAQAPLNTLSSNLKDVSTPKASPLVYRSPLEQTIFELREFIDSSILATSLTSKEKAIFTSYLPHVESLSKNLVFLHMHKSKLDKEGQVDLHIINTTQIPSLVEQWKSSHNTTISFEIKKNLALSFASIQDFLTEKTMDIEKQLLDKSLVEKVYTQSKYLKSSK